MWLKLSVDEHDVLLPHALAAWRDRRTGRFRVVDEPGHVIEALKDGKMLLLCSSSVSLDGNLLKIVAFPKLEHFEEFRKAASGGNDPSYPAFENRSAIGTMQLTLASGEQTAKLKFLQQHFGTDTNSEFKLPRSLATRYFGWQARALQHAIGWAHTRGKALDIPGWCLFQETTALGEKRAAPFLDCLKTACRNLGVELLLGNNVARIPLSGGSILPHFELTGYGASGAAAERAEKLARKKDARQKRRAK
ncbi:MAG: hypothetical protein AABW54_01910 [Candidatus Micrarchaeota archaeon]